MNCAAGLFVSPQGERRTPTPKQPLHKTCKNTKIMLKYFIQQTHIIMRTIITFSLALLLAVQPVLAQGLLRHDAPPEPRHFVQHEHAPFEHEFEPQHINAAEREVLHIIDEPMPDYEIAAHLEKLAAPVERETFLREVHDFAPEHEDEIREITQHLQEMRQAQHDLEMNGIDNEEAADYARRLQEEIQAIREHLTNLRADMHEDEPAGAASVVPFPAEDAGAEDDDWEALEELQADLDYRDELIQQLLDELGEDGSDSSSLAASLLAIEEHPIASSGVAIFVLALLYIFRGRIAELSGFGIKVKLSSGGEKTASNEDKKEGE